MGMAVALDSLLRRMPRCGDIGTRCSDTLIIARDSRLTGQRRRPGLIPCCLRWSLDSRQPLCSRAGFLFQARCRPAALRGGLRYAQRQAAMSAEQTASATHAACGEHKFGMGSGILSSRIDRDVG